jgi:flagellar basal-body rod protein FlgB
MEAGGGSMTLPVFKDKVLEQMALGLDWASARQRALAHNLANVDTPGFKRMDLLFPEALLQAGKRLGLAATQPGHFGATGTNTMKLTRETGTIQRNDGNNVDVELETAEMVKNALYYNAIISRASGHIRNLRMVISEGRR